MDAIQERMDSEQRTKEIREIRRMLLDVQFAARRQVGELEQLKRLLAKLREVSKQLEPAEGGSKDLAYPAATLRRSGEH